MTVPWARDHHQRHSKYDRGEARSALSMQPAVSRVSLADKQVEEAQY